MEFRNAPKGNLIIVKQDSVTKEPLEGVEFKITYADGSYVDAEGSTLSSTGLYWTDKEGKITISGISGTVVVTEVQTIPGYTIDENTRTQTVVVNPNDTQILHFYNTPIGGVEIIKVNEDNHSERIPNTTFEIRKVDDALVDTVTTDKNGRVFVALEDGSYYAKEVTSNKSFRLDDTPHYFEIKDGKRVTLQVTNKKLSGIVIHKIDSATGEGIYGVKFVLYDANKKPIGEYTSDDEGYIYIDEIPGGLSGRFYLRELEAAPGYTLDKQYKTVYVSPGKTVEIEWENTAVTGQIQIYKYAAEYNEVTGTAAGTPLKGAVYEIVNARSGKVVDYITTDARGVAASKALPLTRYQIREVTAPAYWQVSSEMFDVTLEYPSQIIKLSAYDKPSSLGVTITKRGNKIMLEELPEYKKLKKCSVFDYVPEWKKREEEGAKRRTAGNRTSAAARNTSSAPPAPQPSPASGKRPDMQPQTSPTEEAAASGSSCGNDNMTPEEIGLVEMTCEAILEGDDPELEEMDDPTRIPPGRGI